MLAEILEGALCKLKRLDDKKVGELHKRFQEPKFYYAAGLRKPPQLKDLRADLIDEELWVWEIFPEGKTQAVGYAGVVCYSGPPFIFVTFFAHDEPEMARDAMLQIVQGYFTHFDEEQLWFYHPKPVPERVHDMLVEGGFDPYEEDHLPGIDLTKETAYRMERHTFVAYYGDESGNYEADEDAAEELNFDES